MIGDYFQTLARYNKWANERLYDACGKLSDADYYAERPAFFRSIHRTLNHILVGDRIWLERLTGQPYSGLKLDQVLYEQRTELANARAREDARILALADQWRGSALEQDLSYRTTKGDPSTTPVILVLGHLFNHQTHHRGQITDLLMQTSIEPPVLDLIYFLRDQ